MVQTDLREIALLDRRGTNSAKWDSLLATFGQEDLLPLWVADMDFKAPKCVRDALHQAVEQGAFGYYRVPDAYYESILGWEKMCIRDRSCNLKSFLLLYPADDGQQSRFQHR